MISTIEYEKKFSNGYIEICVEGVWIKEHRFVVEQFIRRKLKKEEVIHHINEIKTDNRIENLLLFKSAKDHASFHRKIRQHGFTQPRRTEIENLKSEMLFERLRNSDKDLNSSVY